MRNMIAWYKKSKKFRTISSIVLWSKIDTYSDDPKINTPKLVWLNGYCIIEQKDILVKREEKEFELFENIGITDTEGKPIYAECSAVELWSSGSREDFKAIGYFTFCEKTLSYKIRWNLNIIHLDQS